MLKRGQRYENEICKQQWVIHNVGDDGKHENIRFLNVENKSVRWRNTAEKKMNIF